MKKVVFYYGMELPPEQLLPTFHDHHLIVQPYHPLSQQNAWRALLPDTCSVYQYFNCFKISPAEYQLELASESAAYPDPLWDSYILDISDKNNFDYLVRKATSIIEQNQCDGLFLDDLDQGIANGHKEDLIRLISAIPLRSGQKYILNRGFELWHEIDPVETIVLESFVPRQYPEHQDLDWFDSVIASHLAPYSGSNPRTIFHVLDYNLPPKNHTHELSIHQRIGELESRLADLPVKIVHVNKELDQWPRHLP